MGGEGGAGGVFSRHYRLVTIGAVALIFVAAFENLAVTTVMPAISAELNGADLYAVAFAGPLAVSVFGMVVAGLWCDRSGPTLPLYLSVAGFAAGLLIAGTAASMELVVLGRLVQGLGSGGVTVALYVIVARVYPGPLQPRIFGLFAAAWVIPALVGPSIAGVLGETVGWRWVFLGVAVVSLPALALVVPVTRRLAAPGPSTEGAAAPERFGTDGTSDTAAASPSGRLPFAAWLRGSTPRILLALALAVAVLALSVSTELAAPWLQLVAGVALLLALTLLRPLLPPGSLRARRGLPSVMLTRMLLAGGYFSAEVYLPYLFTSGYGLTPSLAGLALTVAGGYFSAEVYLPYLFTSGYGLTPSLAGLALTVAGVAWGVSSVLQGRLSTTIGDRVAIRVGAVTVVAALILAVVTAGLHLPLWVTVTGWAISGAGMGLAYPRLSVLTLAGSTPADQGFNSAALNIADASGPAMALSIAGIVFQSAGGPTDGSFAAVFVFSLALACAAAVVAGRVAPAGFRGAMAPRAVSGD